MRPFDHRSVEHGHARALGRGIFVVHTLLLALYLVSRLSDCGCSEDKPLVVDFEGCDVVRASERAAGVACTFPKLSIHDFPKLSKEQIRARCDGGPPPPRRMTFWVPGASTAAVRMSVDGVMVPFASVSVVPPNLDASGEAGVRISVNVSAVAREIVVSTSDGRTPFRLDVVPEEIPPAKSGLYDPICRWKEDRDGTAERLEKEFADDPDPAVHAKANALIARNARGKREPDAIERFEGAMLDADEAGLLSDKAATALVLANALIEDRSFADAQRVFKDVGAILDKVPVAAAMEPYFRALASLGVGDLHDARERLEASEKRAWRLDLTGHLSDVYQKMMEVLDLLGQHQRARDYADKLEALARLSQYGPCQDAQRAENLGWYVILSGGDPEAARDHFTFALNGFSETMGSGEPGCNNVAERANVLLNLAHVAMDMGRLDEAQERLEAAAAAEEHIAQRRGHTLRLRAFRANLSGRLALERGDAAAAIARYGEAAEIAALERLPYAGVTAAFGLAQGHELLGDVDQALSAYRAADDKLNRWSTLVPLGGGKQRFLGRHDGGMLGYLALLVDRGELESAACVARRNRSRIPALVEWIHLIKVAPEERRDRWLHALEGASSPLAGVEADLLLDRAAAEVVGAALTPSSCAPARPASIRRPGAGEAILVYHPFERRREHGRTTWVGFAITQGGVTMRLVDVDPAWLSPTANITGSHELTRNVAHALLDPFDDVLAEIERSRDAGTVPRVRLLPAESMAFLPIHRLPVRGRPLEERFSTVYGVDLPAREAAPAWAPMRALLVAPEVGLKGTLGEAQRVAEDLKRRGWEVLLLDGASATRDRVLAELPARELLHYAGHGHANGHDGWDDTVDLADGQSLRVQDVLSLREVPRFVTLSACMGAAARADAPAPQGMSLAHAFIAAGSEIVVAARREVGDSVTRDVMSKQYAPGAGFLEDPAAALHEALRTLPDRSNADFRVLVR